MLPLGGAEEFDEILGGLAWRTEELKDGLATAHKEACLGSRRR